MKPFGLVQEPLSPLLVDEYAHLLAITVRAFPGVVRDFVAMQREHLNARRMLRTDEAAEYCGSSASTFEKLRLTGGGPPYSKIGRRVVYRVEDIDSWLQTNVRRSTSDKPASSTKHSMASPK